MPEPRRRRHLTGACAAAVTAAVLVAVPASAQTSDPRWEGSAFDAPLDVSPAELDRSSFTISGTIDHALYDVTDVTVAFGRSDDGAFAEDTGPCVPDSPGSVAGPQADGAETVPFSVSGITWPCNGEYVIRATATAERPFGPPDQLVLDAVVRLLAPPPPVSSVDASADGEAVTVRWDPVADPSPDASGYRVERAGPASDGRFEEISTVDTATTVIDDRPGADGDYRYRVRALRGDSLASPAGDAAIAEVTIGSPAPESTTTTTAGSQRNADRGSRRSAATVPGSRGGPRLPTSSPTTIDTGFESEIDYGAGASTRDRPLDDDSEPGELAAGGEGQSIIRTEGDGAGLVAPAAGAMVLLGWAGHLFYLNRLAKQF